MKFAKSVLLIIILAVVLSACSGEPAAPTMSAEEVGATAQSLAATIIAQTQAAVPTATPLPPTETPTITPLPVTDTPIVPPTLEMTPTTAPAASDPSVDPCSNRVLAANPNGKPTKIRIVNKTKYPVTVSLYLNETASHGECGYRGYTLGKNSDTVISDLVLGCYNLWAWSNDPKKAFNVASGTSCINNSDKWTFEITENKITFIGP